MSDQYIPQAAAIPYRFDAQDQLELLLIRRRKKRKWGIPKGLVDPGHAPQDTARIESFEEAGVRGRLSGVPVGTFTYPKFGGTCRVKVFLLQVTQVFKEFPEQSFRERRWFPWAEAVEAIEREPIKRMAKALPRLVSSNGTSKPSNERD
ncbi:MAG: hypothetical protein AMXMBFR13_04430 [Phycisphaerae bacterium]